MCVWGGGGGEEEGNEDSKGALKVPFLIIQPALEVPFFIGHPIYRQEPTRANKNRQEAFCD